MVRISARRLGKDVERQALRFLKSKGLAPVTSNFRTRRGEIDLIMLDGDCLAFVEVRYRSESSYVDARLSVDAKKQGKLINAARMFLSMYDDYRAHVCRFDIVAVNRDIHGKLSMEWHKDAFRSDS